MKYACIECKRFLKRYKLIEVKGGACSEFVCYPCAHRFDYAEFMPSVAKALKGENDDSKE